MSKQKKIILIASATLISLLILIVAGYFALVLYIERPKVIDKFNGLTLGMSVSDLKFNKGEPAQKDKSSWCDSCEYWSYKPKTILNEDFTVIIKNGMVVAIADEIGFTRHLNAQSLFNSEDIISKYGNPSSVSVNSDQTQRIYCFSKYKLFFYLAKNKILVYGTYDPDSITPHFKEEAK